MADGHAPGCRSARCGLHPHRVDGGITWESGIHNGNCLLENREIIPVQGSDDEGSNVEDPEGEAHNDSEVAAASAANCPPQVFQIVIKIV